MKKSIACAIAVTMAAGATLSTVGSSTAGPFPVGAPAIKVAATTDIVDVRYYRYGGGIVAGLAIGMIGAAIASQYYYPPYYYYPRPYYYAPRYYYPGYAYGPYYYGSYGYYGAPVIYHRHRVIRHYRRHR